MNSAIKTHIQNAVLKTQAASELLDKADATAFGNIGKLLDDVATLVSIAHSQAEAALNAATADANERQPEASDQKQEG